jgi:hypothetical protein
MIRFIYHVLGISRNETSMNFKLIIIGLLNLVESIFQFFVEQLARSSTTKFCRILHWAHKERTITLSIIFDRQYFSLHREVLYST